MNAGPDTQVLPELRQDLQLMQGARTLTGHPTWLIFDPVMHRYFQLDQASFKLLSLWNKHRNVRELQGAVGEDEGLHDVSGKLEELIAFVQANNLVVEAQRGWRTYAARAALHKRSLTRSFLHSYLFFRIPLFRPHRFLARTSDYLAPLFSRAFLIAMAVIGLLGLYLAARQWDQFLSTFQDFYTPEGIALYLMVLVIIKVIHEFAHAYSATRYGCRVPSMGVAFMVMFPVLYTDVTDAWKLQSRKQRLIIGAAGMIAELVLAAVATFLWAFLPEGTAKSIAFVVATISWVLSLVVNLNPLLRFDGYYLLSDALGIENLQSRAFDLGRWKLREWLFGLGHKPPETLPQKMRATLIFYAWATWIYRFFLFLGIALIVYFVFFKVLGVLLFIVEIVWFILRPVWREVSEWISMRDQVLHRPRTYITATLAAVLIGLGFVPLATSVDVPAIIETSQSEKLYPVSPAKIVAITAVDGQQVTAGDVLAELRSPQLENRLRTAELKLQQTALRLARTASDEVDRQQTLVLQRQQALLEEEIAGLRRNIALLTVRAPFDGKVVDMNAKLHTERWVPGDKPLMTVVNDTGYLARGYLSESDLWRVSAGTEGTFVPDDILQPTTPVTVQDVSIANAASIDILYLASELNGPVAVRRTHDDQLVPVEAQYRVDMILRDVHRPGFPVRRGLVKLHGKPESLMAKVWRRTLQVMVRESGA